MKQPVRSELGEEEQAVTGVGWFKLCLKWDRQSGGGSMLVGVDKIREVKRRGE